MIECGWPFLFLFSANRHPFPVAAVLSTTAAYCCYESSLPWQQRTCSHVIRDVMTCASSKCCSACFDPWVTSPAANDQKILFIHHFTDKRSAVSCDNSVSFGFRAHMQSRDKLKHGPCGEIKHFNNIAVHCIWMLQKRRLLCELNGNSDIHCAQSSSAKRQSYCIRALQQTAMLPCSLSRVDNNNHRMSVCPLASCHHLRHNDMPIQSDHEADPYRRRRRLSPTVGVHLAQKAQNCAPNSILFRRFSHVV